MFKQVFFLSVISTVIATAACVVYSKMYIKIVDFTEAVGLLKVLSFCAMACFGGGLVFFGLNMLIKRKNIAEFIFNLLITLATLAAVFFVLDSKDPVFKNEDANIMVFFYKGFVMPMLFFPAMAWVTFKPLFIK